MKYNVGDYLRLGETEFLYFKVEDIRDGRYILRRVIEGDRRLYSIISIVKSDNITFVKVSRTEALLFSCSKNISSTVKGILNG